MQEKDIVEDIIRFMKKETSMLRGEVDKFPLSQIARSLPYKKQKIAYILSRYKTIFDYEKHPYRKWKKWFLKNGGNGYD